MYKVTPRMTALLEDYGVIQEYGDTAYVRDIISENENDYLFDTKNICDDKFGEDIKYILNQDNKNKEVLTCTREEYLND